MDSVQEINDQTGKHLDEVMTNLEYVQRLDDYLNICSATVMTIEPDNNYFKVPSLNDNNDKNNNDDNESITTDIFHDLSLPLDSFHFFQHVSNKYEVFTD